jgi:hypothetical protein
MYFIFHFAVAALINAVILLLAMLITYRLMGELELGRVKTLFLKGAAVVVVATIFSFVPLGNVVCRSRLAFRNYGRIPTSIPRRVGCSSDRLGVGAGDLRLYGHDFSSSALRTCLPHSLAAE